jgi:LPXTG-site transpeptidase (sortase) family protein
MATHGHNQAGHQKGSGVASKAWSRKWSFLGVFLFMLFVTTGALGALDLLPESGTVAVDSGNSLSASASLALKDTEKPVRIEIPDIDLDVTVANPATADVATLDKALLNGAVRYPTSSELGEPGNVIIFGHSSYLPIVRNSAFKAFNDIQKLKDGDRILVTGNDRTFVYEVESVKEADAEEDAIPLTVSGSKLTLATCDSFGTKSDRFIVVANLVESYPAGN